MAKRTPDNCRYIKRFGEPEKDGTGKCLGLARSETDDEPIEPCKRCKYNSLFDDDID